MAFAFPCKKKNNFSIKMNANNLDMIRSVSPNDIVIEKNLSN